MGWVKDQFDREKALGSGIPKVWCALRESIEKAGEEFKERYRDVALTVSIARSGLVYVIVRRGSTEETVEVALNDEAMQVSAIYRYPQPNSKLGFLLEASGDVSLAMGEKPITVEQASRLLLEPILFRRDCLK
jgi:hypothetical protein